LFSIKRQTLTNVIHRHAKQGRVIHRQVEGVLVVPNLIGEHAKRLEVHRHSDRGEVHLLSLAEAVILDLGLVVKMPARLADVRGHILQTAEDYVG